MPERTKMEIKMNWPPGEEARRAAMIRRLGATGYANLKEEQKKCRQIKRAWRRGGTVLT